MTDRYVAKIHGNEQDIGPEAQFRTLTECVSWVEASKTIGDRCIMVDDQNSVVATYARDAGGDSATWREETDKELLQRSMI